MTRLPDDRLTRLLDRLRAARNGDLAAQVEIGKDVNRSGMGEVLGAVEELVESRKIMDRIASVNNPFQHDLGAHVYGCILCDGHTGILRPAIYVNVGEGWHEPDCPWLASAQLRDGIA